MPSSLISVVVGIVLLGLFAGITAPSAAPVHAQRLDYEARAVKDLISLAYGQAVATGTPYAIWYDANARQFTVAEANLTVEPPTPAGVFYHPISRQPATHTLADGVALSPSTSPFFFGGGGQHAYLVFDNWGYPFGVNGGVRFALSQADLALSDGGVQRNVVVEPVSARTSIQ